jgi:hypothetical protein
MITLDVPIIPTTDSLSISPINSITVMYSVSLCPSSIPLPVPFSPN